MYKTTKNLEILQVPLRLLRSHQLWPPADEKITHFWPFVRLISVLCFCCITICCTGMHLWFMYQHPHTMVLTDFIEDLVCIFLYITIYYTIYVMIIHLNELEILIHDLNDYTQFGKPDDIDEVNKRANYFTMFFYCYGWVGSAIYNLSGFLDKSECHKRDIYNTRACGFLLPLKFPFEINTMPKFIVTWIVQSVGLILLITSGITIMSYIYSMIEIFCAKIVHFKKKIKKLGERPENARNELRFCVEYHVKIIKYFRFVTCTPNYRILMRNICRMCKNLNYCWGSLMLYHQMLVTIIESLIGMQFLLNHDLNSVIHFSGWIISLAIPCYAGQRLLDESSEIPLAIYSAQWLNLDRESKKDLVYMLMCANNYLDLNRDGYGPVNLSIVGRVVNNIYSVLMLIYTTMPDI